VDRLNSRACRSLLSLVVALLLASLCGTAAAEPRVSPLADGGVYTFDEAVTTKYQLFNPPTGITHAGGVMSWSYNDASRPPAITKAAVLAQIQASMAKWSAVCRITFVYQGETLTGLSSADGVNVIAWDATNTAITAPTTGITTDAWNGSNTIVDADIRLNAAYSATYSPFSNFDATMTHEVGHSIGLQHSDVANQVMSGPPLTSYDGLSTLGSDDIAGCVHLYGAAGSSGPPPDTLAPSVPTGLTATTISTTQVNLAWNASTDNVGVTSYKIFQGGTMLGTVTGTGASVTGLSQGTMYSFTVSACDAASNCSAQSASASATTLSADAQAPTVPTGLTATTVGTSQINLAWNPSTDNVGVTSYNVFQGATLLGTVPGASAGVTGLTPGTMYSFTVSACDAASNCSAQSASASATTTAALPTCTGSQPPNDTQVLACSAGQTGSIVQTRSYSCVGTTWTPGAYQTVSSTCSNGTTIRDYQDMWWAGQQENGWGLTITQHQDALFLAWYIYDSSGTPLWVVMPSGQWNAAHTTYSGALYVPSGSWYGNYQVGRFTANASVGNASIAFTSTSAGTLTYSVNGVSGSKAISRLAFGPVNTAPITNYMDMWWGGQAENGWGVVLTQQYHNIFAAWYTYDASGVTTWLVMPDGTWSGNTYTGALYRTRGAPLLGTAYNPSALVVTQAGTLTLTFTDANTATMTYTVDGLTQTKPLTRLPF
jgi:chitinase